MIGNDIIDLALAQKESNWKRKGFLEKLFTLKEQLLISGSDNPEIKVWNLWSRKEAAYKIYNRHTQNSGFIPQQLECFDIEILEGILYGKVVCYGEVYFTKTIITSEFVETNAVANLADFEKIKECCASKKISKQHGIPNYFDEKQQVLFPVSKSHHGRFERIISF